MTKQGVLEENDNVILHTDGDASFIGKLTFICNNYYILTDAKIKWHNGFGGYQVFPKDQPVVVSRASIIAHYLITE